MAVSLLVSSLHAGAAGAQFSRPTSSNEVDYPETAWAVTVCGTRPITWFNDEMPTRLRETVEVHEAAHRRRMESFLSCTDFRAWKRESAEHNIQWEAEAFCVGAGHDVLTGKSGFLGAAVWEHARLFATYFSWTPDYAASAIYRYCKAPRLVAPQ